jgi:hypothetical protein
MAVPIGALVVLACVAASPVFAAPTIADVPAVGEIVLPGRVTQSDGDVPELEIGSVFNVASWDGERLGTQWMLTCGVQNLPADKKVSLDGKGNGFIWSETGFDKGSFVLSKYGPWNTRGEDVVGMITRTQVTMTEIMVENACVKVDYEMTAAGKDQFGRTVSFTIKHCMEWGETEDGSPPKGYPDFLNLNCQPGRTAGYWWELDDVIIDIQGITGPRERRPVTDASLQSQGVHQGSWGALKVIYR